MKQLTINFQNYEFFEIDGLLSFESEKLATFDWNDWCEIENWVKTNYQRHIDDMWINGYDDTVHITVALE